MKLTPSSAQATAVDPRPRNGSATTCDAVEAVQPQAHLRELGRESRRMGPVLFAALDGLVGDEPRIAAAAHAGGRGPPAADVRLVLIAHADGLSIDRRVARRGEVEDELVAVVDEAAAVDRLVVTDRQVVVEVGAGAGERLLDRDRLDPVNRVLQPQMRPDRLGDVDAPSRDRSAWRRRSGTASPRAGAPVATALNPLARSTPGTRDGASCRRSCGSECRGCRAAT